MSIMWAAAFLAVLAGGAAAAVWAVINPSWIKRKNLARRLAGWRGRG